MDWLINIGILWSILVPVCGMTLGLILLTKRKFLVGSFIILSAVLLAIHELYPIRSFSPHTYFFIFGFFSIHLEYTRLFEYIFCLIYTLPVLYAVLLSSTLIIAVRKKRTEP